MMLDRNTMTNALATPAAKRIARKAAKSSVSAMARHSAVLSARLASDRTRSHPCAQPPPAISAPTR